MFDIIVAYSKNKVIGINNDLPWNIKEDLKYFKDITNNNTIIMGRKTWESLPKKPLPNRTNLVLSKTKIDNVLTFGNIDEILNYCNDFDKKYFVIGGEQIYKLFLEKKIVKHVYATEIDIHVSGDKYFPDFDGELIYKKSSSNNDYKWCWKTYKLL